MINSSINSWKTGKRIFFYKSTSQLKNILNRFYFVHLFYTFLSWRPKLKPTRNLFLYWYAWPSAIHSFPMLSTCTARMEPQVSPCNTMLNYRYSEDYTFVPEIKSTSFWNCSYISNIMNLGIIFFAFNLLNINRREFFKTSPITSGLKISFIYPE